MSAVCTYQGLFGDQVHKVKDISFEQIDLLVFEYANQLGKFFIGSVDSIITVWDYEKLIIVNRIDMVKLFRL